MGYKKGCDNMSNMGRPRSDNPKNIRFSIRLDGELNAKLERYAEKHGITVAEAIRTAIKRMLRVK